MMRVIILGLICLLAVSCDRKPAENAIAPIDGVIRLSEQFTGDFALIDKTGVAVSDEDLAGRLMLVYFGFTNCPDVCPGDISVMSAALNALGERAENVAAIFITVDPARDTREQLAQYFAFDDRIIALTGDEAAVDAARASFKLFAEIVPLEDSALNYTVNHQRMFFVSDRQGQPIYAILGGAGPKEVADLLRRNM